MPGLIAKGVASHSSEEMDVVFYPTEASTGPAEFSVSVYSLSNPSVTSTAQFSVDVSGIRISDFRASVSGSSVRFDLGLYSPEDKELKGKFALADSSGREIASIQFTETVSGQSKITRDLILGEMPPAGLYTTKVFTEGIERAKYPLSIPPVRNIVQTVEEVSQGLTKEVTITIRNEGNVIEKDYSFQQAIPIDMVTGMLTRSGENCREEGGLMVCNYYLGEIKPGSAAYVSYSMNYWPAFNGYLLLTFIMAGLIIYSFLRVTSPRILKRHIKKGEGLHSISIHVKNPFLHNLRDVTVRDWVSPLAQVLQDEIVSTVPVIRRVDEGTELIWKLGDIKPREERILQYKVRSLVHGRLKMPSAHLKFTSSKGEKKIKLASNPIILD